MNIPAIYSASRLSLIQKLSMEVGDAPRVRNYRQPRNTFLSRNCRDTGSLRDHQGTWSRRA